jgi:hypothetical protein
VLYEGGEHTLLWIVRDRSEIDGDHVRQSAAAFPQPAAVRQVVVAAEEAVEPPVDVSIPDPEGRVARRYGIGAGANCS